MATIDDIPDDVLIDIFKLLMETSKFDSRVNTDSPSGVHQELRSTCRRWTPLADWARLDGYKVTLDTNKLADADASALRARQPAAFKKLVVNGLRSKILPWEDWTPEHTLALPHALESLARDPDLRRSLRQLDVRTACCRAGLSGALPAVVSLTALSKLGLEWLGHPGQARIESTWLEPLSQLVRLERLKLSFCGHILPDRLQSEPWLITKWPALPDAPRLTSLKLSSTKNFILEDITEWAPHLETTDDYLGLRAALDEGTSRPHLWTGLRELHVDLEYACTSGINVHERRSAPGAEWLPLAGQITKLTVSAPEIHPVSPRPPTGIVAGLGVLTAALRELYVWVPANFDTDNHPHPVDWSRVHAPRLIRLSTNYAAAPLDASRFPQLEEVCVSPRYIVRHPGVILSSLAGRSRLRVLELYSSQVYYNVAELFVGGGGLPALERLSLFNGWPVWDESQAAGAPDADAFANNVRALLPSLKCVEVAETKYWDSSESEFDEDNIDVEYDSESDDSAAWEARYEAELDARYEAWLTAREEARRPLTKFRTIVGPALERLCAGRRRG